MKEITVFYFPECPYCRQLERILKDWNGRPELKDVAFRWVDEHREPEVADQYPYYYVPTLFEGKRKLYEADPSHTEPVMRRILEEKLLAGLSEH